MKRNDKRKVVFAHMLRERRKAQFEAYIRRQAISSLYTTPKRQMQPF